MAGLNFQIGPLETHDSSLSLAQKLESPSDLDPGWTGVGKIKDLPAGFEALLLDQGDPRLDLIEPKIVFVLGSRVICLSSEIPKSWLETEIRIPTGFRVPVNKHMTARSIFTHKDIEMTTSIIIMKSRLIYALSETLDSTRLYWHLDEKMNETRTYRDYEFVLYFDQFPLRSSPQLIQYFQNYSNNLGMILISSRGIQGTQWWVRECLRDVWELEMNHSDKVLVEGKQDLYIFQRNGILGEKDLQDFLEDLTSRMSGFISLKRFPRKTPHRFVQTRCLQPLKNGQWEAPSNIPMDIDLLQTRFRATYLMTSLKELFWFLLLLMFSSTYPFLARELQIWIKTNEIQVQIETEYLPDFLRVRTASRVIGRELVGTINIFYVPPEITNTDQTVVTFYDSNNGLPTWLSGDIPVPGIIVREAPPDLSLETRLKFDPQTLG